MNTSQKAGVNGLMVVVTFVTGHVMAIGQLAGLVIGLLVMASAAIAQDKQPDLIPVVTDADKGIVEIRNIGDASAKPSRVFVVCSRIPPESKQTERCAAGLQLPGFIDKWNVLPIDIPALPPAASYRLHLFGAGAFQRRPGLNAMKITVDPLKHMVESSEQNNYARLDTVIKTNKIVTKTVPDPQPGLLILNIVDDHNNKLSRVSWSVNRSGKQYATVARGEGKSSASVHINPGHYDLHVWHELIAMKKSAFNIDQPLGQSVEQVVHGIQIHSDQTVEKRIVFEHVTPGKLAIDVVADGKAVPLHIHLSDDQGHPVLSIFSARFDAHTQLKLMPGYYRLQVSPVDKGGVQGPGYKEQMLAINIHSGETISKKLTFIHQRKGQLILTALVNGGRNKAEITIRMAGTKGRFGALGASYNLIANKADLLPGHYDLSIRPLEFCLSSGGVDVFHGGVDAPGINNHRIKGVEPVILHDIEIKAGEVLEKTVRFKSDSHYVNTCM